MKRYLNHDLRFALLPRAIECNREMVSMTGIVKDLCQFSEGQKKRASCDARFGLLVRERTPD